MKNVDSSIRLYRPLYFSKLAASILLLPLCALPDYKNTAFATFLVPLAKFFAYYAGILLNVLADQLYSKLQ